MIVNLIWDWKISKGIFIFNLIYFSCCSDEIIYLNISEIRFPIDIQWEMECKIR